MHASTLLLYVDWLHRSMFFICVFLFAMLFVRWYEIGCLVRVFLYGYCLLLYLWLAEWELVRYAINISNCVINVRVIILSFFFSWRFLLITVNVPNKNKTWLQQLNVLNNFALNCTVLIAIIFYSDFPFSKTKSKFLFIRSKRKQFPFIFSALNFNVRLLSIYSSFWRNFPYI